MSNKTLDPRDLLFGLLALQVGLISQEHLVAAFQTWSRERRLALPDVLLEKGSIDASQRDLIRALVDDHVRRHAGDVDQSLAAAVAGSPARDQIAGLGDAELTASLGIVNTRTRQTEVDDPHRTVTHNVESQPASAHRFRVLRPHASGGLGTVSVALDNELHREVALKQIHARHADDPASRSRFLLEAELTGGLEHPGIVPVYGLGFDAAGRPYLRNAVHSRRQPQGGDCTLSRRRFPET